MERRAIVGGIFLGLEVLFLEVGMAVPCHDRHVARARVCASFRDDFDARSPWCSPLPLDHSSSLSYLSAK